jgi:hypothetical protein
MIRLATDGAVEHDVSVTQHRTARSVGPPHQLEPSIESPFIHAHSHCDRLMVRAKFPAKSAMVT